MDSIDVNTTTIMINQILATPPPSETDSTIPVRDFTGVKINPELTEKEQESIKQILSEFWDCLAFSPDQIGHTDVITHRIDTGTHKPIHQRLRTRYSHEEKLVIEQQVKEMLDTGIIEPGFSNWSSNVVLAKKADGKWRFCVDFRKLNELTTLDPYPLPRILDILDSFSGSCYFSALDLIWGFWQVLNDPETKDRCSFSTENNQYIFNRMPFGLKNSPSTFQRMMDKVFMELRHNSLSVYLDDVIVFGPTLEIHNARLVKALICLRKAHLTLNPKKCNFGFTKLKILGHIIDRSGVKPNPAKIAAITSLKPPTTIKELRGFLGCIGYFRRFLKDFGLHAKVLNDLLKHDNIREWGEKEQLAFDTLKANLAVAPALAHYDHTKELIISTDACKIGVAAVLSQCDQSEVPNIGKKDLKTEVPIGFASKALRGAATRYPPVELEALAVLFAIKEFRPYIALRHFFIVTDHLSLVFLKTMKDPINTRVARWGLALADLTYTLIYRGGVHNQAPDYLSRHPNPFDKPINVDKITEIPTYSIPVIPDSKPLPRLDVSCKQNTNQPDSEEFELDIIYYQLKDDFCNYILNHLEDKTEYVLYEGLLCKEEAGRHRIVIPAILRGIIIDSYHANPTSGHLGLDKLYDKLKSRFFWPNMRENVKEYLLKCHSCRFHKIMKVKKPGFLHPINPFSQIKDLAPMSLLAMDLLGPFPVSNKGNRVIIVITDYATRFVATGALKSGSASDVAEFLVEDVVCKLGCFKYILSDNGLCFRSKLISELGRTLGFKQKFTSIFHPSCNGLVERFNATLARMLAAFVPDASFTEWDKFLAPVTFAHNTSLHATLKQIPFTLMFGRDAILPQDLNLALTSSSLPADHIRDRLNEAFKNARQSLEKRQSYDKDRHDSRKIEKEFFVGDKVVLEVPIRQKGVPDKLQPKVRGPYTIVANMGNGLSYIIEPCTGSGKKNRERVHVSNLHPYKDPLILFDPSTNPVPTDPINPFATQKPKPTKKVTFHNVPDSSDSESDSDVLPQNSHLPLDVSCTNNTDSITSNNNLDNNPAEVEELSKASSSSQIAERPNLTLKQPPPTPNPKLQQNTPKSTKVQKRPKVTLPKSNLPPRRSPRLAGFRSAINRISLLLE